MGHPFIASVGPLLLVWLLVCIVLIVLLSAKIKLHAAWELAPVKQMVTF